MRKFFDLFLLLGFCLVLFGCGGRDQNAESNPHYSLLTQEQTQYLQSFQLTAQDMPGFKSQLISEWLIDCGTFKVFHLGEEWQGEKGSFQVSYNLYPSSEKARKSFELTRQKSPEHPETLSLAGRQLSCSKTLAGEYRLSFRRGNLLFNLKGADRELLTRAAERLMGRGSDSSCQISITGPLASRPL